MAEYYELPCNKCSMEIGEATTCLTRGMPGHQPEHQTASTYQDPFDFSTIDFVSASSYTDDGSDGQPIGHETSLLEDPFWGLFNDVSDGYINPAVLLNDGTELALGEPYQIGPFLTGEDIALGEQYQSVPSLTGEDVALDEQYKSVPSLTGEDVAPDEQNHSGPSSTGEDVAPDNVDDGNNNVPQKRGRGRPPGSKNKPKDPSALPKERRAVGRPPGRDYMSEVSIRKRERRRAAEAVKRANGTSTPAPVPAPGPASGLAPALGPGPALGPAPGPAPGLDPASAFGSAPAPDPAPAYLQMSERLGQVDDSDEYFFELLAPVAASIRRGPTYTAYDMQQYMDQSGAI